MKIIPIRIWHHPKVYIRDKYFTFKENPRPYIPSILVWLFAIVALITFISNAIVTFSTVEAQVIALAFFLFVVGCVNVQQTKNVEKFRTRLNREIDSFEILHSIAEEVREYNTLKKRISDDVNEVANSPKKPDINLEIVKTIKHICNNLLSYLEKRHRKGVTITFKYQSDNDTMNSIRVGKYAKERDDLPELIKDSHVFKFFNEQKETYIYIQNTDKFNAEELKVVGDRHTQIQNRANKQGYKTFLAFPINTGNLNIGGTPVVRTALGFLGFDHAEAYSFGNFHDQEKDFLASVVDSLSDIVWDFKKVN